MCLSPLRLRFLAFCVLQLQYVQSREVYMRNQFSATLAALQLPPVVATVLLGFRFVVYSVLILNFSW